MSYISTWEFLTTLEKSEKHSPSARASPHFSSVFKNSLLKELNNALRAFFISLIRQSRPFNKVVYILSLFFFHKARALCQTSVLLKYKPTHERAQFTIHFIKEIKKACSSSILELYKHLGIFNNTREEREALTFGSCFSALLKCL